MRHLPIRIALATVAATGLTALAGCGSDDSPTATTTSTSAAASPAPAADAQSILDSIPSPFDDAPRPADTYLGSVDGTNAYIAVVVSGDKAVAFVCDGATTWAWPAGSFDNSRLALADPNGTTVDAQLEGSTVTGTVQINGTDHAFTAAPAQTNEGVYRTALDENGQTFTVGWIVREEGGRGLERSATGTFRNAVNISQDDGADRRQDEQNEQRRCEELERDLADARATLSALQARPREGGNIQMVALAQQRLDRLINAQC